jgi:FMN phosphatase YigB (HAD superfamily)
MQAENVALFDMDGTLCDYDGQLSKDMKKLMAPGEPEFAGDIRDAPGYLKERADIIRASQKWWESLPRLELGWNILKAAQDNGYKVMILTQGPKSNPASWAGKKLWIDKNLGPDVDVTITRDKGLVYGKVLVDDFPKYIERWLTWRKNGLVIMPAHESNKDYKHKQVIRYDGTNLNEVRSAMAARLATAPDVDQV